MPHADADTMASTINGEKPSSAFLSHIVSYPVVGDSITTFKQNPYGQKSLALVDSGYQTFAKPILPYFAKPYEYVSPWVVKIDGLGDAALSKVDETFPTVKKPTGELYDNAKGTAFFPIRKGMEGKDYVLNTYNSEVKKVGGEGLVTYGKAAVTTTLIISSDALTWLSNVLSAKKEQTKEVVNDKLNN